MAKEEIKRLHSFFNKETSRGALYLPVHLKLRKYILVPCNALVTYRDHK